MWVSEDCSKQRPGRVLRLVKGNEFYKWWRQWLQGEIEKLGSCAKSALTSLKLVCTLCFLMKDTQTASRQERGQQLAVTPGRMLAVVL